jgi:immune inhibitor A
MRVAPVLLAIALATPVLPWMAGISDANTPTTHDDRPHLMPPGPPHAWPRGVLQGAFLPSALPAQASGVARLLVLLVEFPDAAYDPANDAPSLDARFNVLGDSSVRAYFEEVSLGALTVQATIVPTWWTSARTMSSYGDDGANVDDANGSIYELVAETVALADPAVDFSAFDADANRIVDHLVVVHAGGAQEEEPENVTRIWSHRWTVPSLFADGVRIAGYIMVGESSPIGVVAHEFAHDLGLPDLYDTTPLGDPSSEGGVGRWDLMAHGAWNGYPPGSSPAHLSAWSRLRLGWTVATDVNVADVRLAPVESYGTVLRLPIPGLTSEYFLVENRQRIGFDAALPSTGLLIWHVDDTRSSNDDDARRWVDLEEADEAASGDRPLDPEDAWSDTPWGFGPETTPSSASYAGGLTGWRVRDLVWDGGNVTARIFRAIPRDVGVMAVHVPRLVDPNTTVDAEAVLVNEGSGTENVNVTARIYRERIEPSALVSERQASAVLPSVVATRVPFSFDVGGEGRYLVHVSIGPPDDVIGNDERFAHVLVRSTYFRDDMESGAGSWTTDGSADDPHRWVLLDQGSENGSAHSAQSAWRFGLEEVSSPNPSPPEWHALTSAPVAVPAGPVHLTFYQRYALWPRPEAGPVGRGESDIALVEVRTAGGPWSSVGTFRGRDLAWRAVSLNLSANVSGPTTLEVRFNISAGIQPDRGGWWIDDVAVASGGLGRALLFLDGPPRIETAPGTSVRVEARLVNLGEFEETVDLAYVLPDAPWVVVVSGPDAVRLGPDRDVALRFSIAVPEDSTGEVTVLISAKSRDDPDIRLTLSVVIHVIPRGPPSPWPFLGMIVVAAAALTVIGALAFRRRRSRT